MGRSRIEVVVSSFTLYEIAFFTTESTNSESWLIDFVKVDDNVDASQFCSIAKVLLGTFKFRVILDLIGNCDM